MISHLNRSFVLLSLPLFAFATLSSASLAGASAKDASPASLRLQTDKDASLIRESYCCGFVADKNFGHEATVDAGQYHHRSEALIGFSRSAIPAFAALRKATLEVEARIAGSGPAAAEIGFSNSDWDESLVTFDSRPEALATFRYDFTSGLNQIDVTEIVQEALAGQGDSFSFLIRVPASGQSNIFITSKEGSAERSAALTLEFDSPAAL